MQIAFRRLPLVLSAVFLLSSCHTSRKAVSSEHRLLDTISVSARNNPMDIYRATSTRVWNIIHTRLELRFDFAKREAIGEAELSIMPYAQTADTLVLDAKGMRIESVQWKEGEVRALPYRYADDQLKIAVAGLPFGSLGAARQQTITIRYIAMPYSVAVGGSKAITEDRGLYFINTDGAIPGKPVQIWTQGETESNSHWFPTIDKPNQRSTFTIGLTVPDSMQTLSNGRLMHSEPAAGGLRRDEWQMSEPITVYTAMVAIGRFSITKDTWKDAQGLDHEVSYYVEPAFASTARGIFKNTPEMIAFFSRFTGVSFPWHKYSQVAVRDYVSGAMENTAASLFGEFVNKNARQLIDESNEDVVSHELFHQWFGDYVTAESWSNLTLNESFATYGELLWRNFKYGKASADELAREDLERYLASAERADPPLLRYYYRDREEMFDRISYQKGGIILRYIHALTGDTLFSRAMEIYLRRNALESAEVTHWRLALESVTGKDWNPFFNQWYVRGGHPVLHIRHSYDDAKGVLTLICNNSSVDSFRYTLPMKVGIINGNNYRLQDWTVTGKTTILRIPYVQGARPYAIPDAMHVVPAAIHEEKTLESWLAQIHHAPDYISKRLAIDAAIANEAKPLAPEILEASLQDSLRGIRTYALYKLAGVNRQAWKDRLLPQVRYLMQNDGHNKVRAAAFGVLGAWKDRTEIPSMVAAVNDSSYLIAGSALQALYNLNPDTAYLLAKTVLQQDPKSYLQQAAWTAVVTKGAPQDFARFEAAAKHVYGGEKMSLANNLQRYAMAVKDISLYEQAVSLMAEMAKSEAIRGYRLAIGANIFELRELYAKKGDSERKAIAARYAEVVMKAEPEEENLKTYRTFGGK